MGDNRDLKHGEKRLGVFSSEKGRDRANAQRAIEGLSQNDQMIYLLNRQVELLDYIAQAVHRLEARQPRA